MKKYIIDGYNLLKSPAFHTPGNLSLEARRDHLIRRLKSYAGSKRCRVIVVFDNSVQSKQISTGVESKTISVKFTKPSREADDLIKELIRKEEQARNLIVVSSDREICNSAKDHGIRSLSSEEFCNLMHGRERTSTPKKTQATRPEKQEHHLSKKELAYWLEMFGKDADDE